MLKNHIARGSVLRNHLEQSAKELSQIFGVSGWDRWVLATEDLLVELVHVLSLEGRL